MVTKKKEESAEEMSSEAKVCVSKKCCGLSYKLWYLIIIVILVVAGYYAWTVYGTMRGSAGENKMTDQQIAAIVAKVKQHMVLPDKEVPQMAEIKDAALAAKEQPFLAGSQNGDVLMVYASISKAILYSPARDRIINVGPVQMNNPDSSDQTSASASDTASSSVAPKKK